MILTRLALQQTRDRARVNSGVEQAKSRSKGPSPAKRTGWRLAAAAVLVPSVVLLSAGPGTSLSVGDFIANHASLEKLRGFWAGVAITLLTTVIALFLVFQSARKAVFSHGKGVFEYPPYYSHPLP